MFMKHVLLALISIVFLTACGQESTDSSSSAGGTVDRAEPAAEKKPDVASDADAKYQKGVHYTVMDEPLDVDAAHILEFFWYGCPHCATADPIIKEYVESNEAAALEQVHSAIPQWAMDADVYWALRGLGEEERLHNAYMSTRQSANLTDQKDRETWLAALGAETKAMNKSLVSDEIMAERKKYAAIEKRMDAGGVPAFLVGGKYVIQLEGLGSWDELTKTVDWLIKTQP